MSLFSSIRKALVPVVVAAALWLLHQIGVGETPELEQQVTLVITAVLVYFIPNN